MCWATVAYLSIFGNGAKQTFEPTACDDSPVVEESGSVRDSVVCGSPFGECKSVQQTHMESDKRAISQIPDDKSTFRNWPTTPALSHVSCRSSVTTIRSPRALKCKCHTAYRTPEQLWCASSKSASINWIAAWLTRTRSPTTTQLSTYIWFSAHRIKLLDSGTVLDTHSLVFYVNQRRLKRKRMICSYNRLAPIHRRITS